MEMELTNTQTYNRKESDWLDASSSAFSEGYSFTALREYDFYDYLISGSISFVICISFLLFFSGCRTWALLPLWACGMLAASDIAAWFRGKTEIFDPMVLAGAFFYLTTFLAPLLHLAYDLYGMDLFILDWPAAFARMAIVNLFGLLVYKFFQRSIYSKTSPLKSYWQIDHGRFIVWAVPILCISFVAAMIIRIFFGGLVKVEGGTRISSAAAGYTAYLSVLRMLGDSFVLLLMACLIVLIGQKIYATGRRSSWFTVGILLLTTAVMQFIMVGMRGSRSVILTTVIGVGIMIHFVLKRFTKKVVLIGLACVFVFLYLYDFRKKAGLYGFQAFYNPQVRKSLSEQMGGFSPVSTLLGDLSRSDLQALMLANLTQYKDEIQYKPVWGTTYAMGFAMFVPRAIWKDKPMGLKKDAGTELQGLLRGTDKSTRQYGLAGEAMLNFGWWGILPAFCLFGIIMGYFRKKLYTVLYTDARLIIFPLFVIMLQNMVIQDSDNLIFALLRDGTLLFILIYFSTFRSRLQNT